MKRIRASVRTAVGTVLAGAAVVYGLPAPPAAATVSSPEALATAHGLATFAVALDLLADTPAFATKLPLTDRSPADVLGFPTLFTRTLGAPMAAFDGDYAALKSAIEGASGSGVTYTVGTITPVDGVATFTIHVVVHGTQDVPISYVRPGTPPDDPNPVPAITVHGSDNASGQTGTVPVDLTLTADFPFTMDSHVTAPDSGGNPVIDVPHALSLNPAAATMTLASGDSSESDLSFTSRYGFTDVSVTGSAAYELVGSTVFTDPDAAGSVTQDEWANTLLPDWLDFTLTDPAGATPSVDVALTFDSSLLPSDTHGGTVTYHDATAPTYVDLRPLDAAASAPTAPTVALANLEPFTRIGADDALTGLSQFSAALAAAQARIDQHLPLLDKKFSDAFSPADELQTLVEHQGSAAIICGKANTQPPTGADLAGTTWYCQAVTKQDVTNVHWHHAGGTSATGITGATTATTVGTAPTTNITVTGVTGEPDVEVDFDVTAQQSDGSTATETFTAKRRIRSAQELRTALDALAGSTISVAYDMAAQTLAYDVTISDDPAAMPATFDIGDALRPRTGLSGISLATPGNPVSLDVGTTALHATYGLLLQSDVAALDSDGLNGQSDRYYAKLGSGHEVSVDGVAVSSTGDYDFTGKVGYLGVDATATSFALAATGSGAALAADLGTDAAHPIAGLDNLTIPGGVSLRRLLAMPDPVTPTFALGLDASFDVAARGNLASLTDGTDQATVDVTWDDYGPTTKPLAEGNEPYDTYLKPFDVLPLVEGAAGNASASTTVLTDSDTDFLHAFGHDIAAAAKLGATLQNGTTGATCEDVTVTDAHTLTCNASSVVDNGTPGGQTIAGMSGGRRQSVRVGTDADGKPTYAKADGTAVTTAVYDDNSWRAGDIWRVSGDQDALRALLIENLFDISNRLDQATEPGYITPLPMLGITPKQLTPQFGKLRDVATALAARVPVESQAEKWKASHSYAANDLVLPTAPPPGQGLLFRAGAAGTSGATEPAWPTTAGGTVVNGGVTWTAVAAVVPPATLQDLVDAIGDEMDAVSAPVNGVTLSAPSVSVDLATLDHTVGASTLSARPHAQLTVDWDGAATVDAPVQIDLAPMSQLTMHGLADDTGAVGAMSVATTSSARVRFAVPLSPDIPTGDVLVRADTGVTDLTATLDSSTVDFTASVGSLAVRLGTHARLFGQHDPVVGTHTEDSVLTGTLTAYVLTGHADSGSGTTTLSDGSVDFVAQGVQTGAVVTRSSTTCTVTGITQHTLTCDLGSGNAWANNDAYSLTQDGNPNVATADALTGQGFMALDEGDVIRQGTASCVVTATTAKTQKTINCPISSGTWDKDATFTVESGAVLTDGDRTGDATATDDTRGFDTFLSAGNADTTVTNLDGANGSCTVGAITDTTVACASGTRLSGNATWQLDDRYRLDLGDPAKVLVDPGTGFDGMGLVGRTLHNLTDAATCLVTSATKDTLTCSAGLSNSGHWDTGDYYQVDGPGVAKANLVSWTMSGATDRDTATYATNTNLGTSAVGGLTPQSCSESFGSPVSGDVCALLATQLVDPTAAHGTVQSVASGTVHTADTTGIAVGTKLRNETDGFNCIVSAVTAATFDCAPPPTEAWTSGDAWAVDEGKWVGVLTYHASFGGTSVAGGLGTAFSDAVAGDEPLEFSLLSVAMQMIRGYVQDGLDGTIADEPFPLIGLDRTAGSHVMDALQALEDALAETDVPAFHEGPNSITGFQSDIETYLEGVFDDIGSSLLTIVDPDGITVTLTCKTTPHSSGSHDCADGTDTDENIVDVRVQTTIGGDAATDEHMDQGCTSAKCDQNVAQIHLPRFESGLPGLELDGPSGLDARVGWTFDLDFGLARDIGPYIGTAADDPILEVGADVHLPEASAACTASLPAGAAAGQTEEPTHPNGGFTATRCFQVTLGLLQGVAFDGTGSITDDTDGKNADRTGLELKATLDIAGAADDDGRISLDSLTAPDRELPTFAAQADGNIDLYFVTGISTSGSQLDSTLPSVEGTVHVGFHADGTLKGSQAEASDFSEISYGDLAMNAGSFVNGFLKPIIDEVYKLTRPFKAVADILMAPIPVLKQIAELTGQQIGTLLDLLEQAAAKPLALVRSVVGLVGYIADIAEGITNTLVGLGSWNNGVQSKGTFSAPKKAVTTGPCGKTDSSGNKQPKDCQKKFKKGGVQYKQSIVQLKNCPASGCTGKELARTMTRSKPKIQKFDGFGITFPFLNDTSQVMGLLLGEQATLVRFDPGAFGVTTSLHYSWGPFMAGPVPVDISIGGTIGLSAHFAVGYDTRGIYNVLQQDRDSFDSNALLDGIFIDDLDLAGNDVDEIQLTFVVTLGASVSVSIFKVGLYGGVGITIGFDLVDPDNDGKLYLDEIEQFKDNPICLFRVRGLLDFFFGFFVEVDLKFWSNRWEYELFRLKPPITLFEAQCTRTEPDLAVVSGSNLRLNIGDVDDGAGHTYAQNRHYRSTRTNEKFVVRQLAAVVSGQPTQVEVEFSGLVQQDTVPAGGKILADAGSGNDVIELASGATEDGTEVPFTIAATINAGTGDDQVTTGAGDDTVHGDGGNDKLTTAAGNDTAFGDDNDDNVDGGLGSDVLSGGNGTDRVNGNAGSDWVAGDAGDDTLDGGPGLNAAQAATARSRNSKLTVAGANALLDGNDVVIGGAGTDGVSGHLGDDYLFGGSFKGLTGTADTDRKRLEAMNGTIPSYGTFAFATACNAAELAGDGGDQVKGESGNDVLVGDAGDDTLSGGIGNDSACGGTGADTVEGDSANSTVAGNDTLRGGAGADTLFGRGGDDTLDGEAGEDLLDAGDGTDRVIGGAGADAVDAGAGNDIVLGDTGTIPVSAPITTSGSDVKSLVTSDSASDASVGSTPIVCRASATVLSDGKVDLDGDGAADSGRFLGHAVTAGVVKTESAANYNGTLGDRIVTNGLVQGGAATVAGIAMSVRGRSDCVVAGDGHDAVFAGPGDDWVVGESGRDYVQGDAGSDYLRGYQDADEIDGGADADDVYGDTGADLLTGGAGNDTVHGGIDADVAYGGPGNDTVSGEDGDDILVGGSATAATADGADVVDGGAGNDTVAGDNAAPNSGHTDVTLFDLDTPASYSGNDTLGGQTGNDTVYGQGGADTINGNEGNDRLDGNGGADTINGNGGNDRMSGGTEEAGKPDGADTMHGGQGTDTMMGDNATAGASVTLYDRPMAGGAAVSATLSGNDTMWGDEGDDSLYGQGGDDLIRGDTGDTAGTGNDYAEGGPGADTMWGAGGTDRLIGGSDLAGELDGNDTVHAGDAADIVTGDNAAITLAGAVTLHDVDDLAASAPSASVSGDDTIYGDAAADRIYGQGGNDDIRGGAAGDAIEGDAGADHIWGEDGDDRIAGGNGVANQRDHEKRGDGWNDVIDGGEGADAIAGDNATITAAGVVTMLDVKKGSDTTGQEAGDDQIYGRAADDTIYGQGGDDTVYGGDGNDYVEGNGDADTLNGEAGTDRMTGGTSQATSQDGDDVMSGGTEDDVLTGDNATISAAGAVALLDVKTSGQTVGAEAGGDEIYGDDGTDVIYGQSGADELHGGNGPDYVEGNAGADIINGGAGADRITGGSGVDNGGSGGALRELRNTLDTGDVIHGNEDADIATGDNARITAAGVVTLYDEDVSGSAAPPADISGDDSMSGDAGTDRLYGQSGNDAMSGGSDQDVMEGNTGADTMSGDGDDDVMVGGSTHDAHIRDGAVTISGTPTGDTVTGNDGVDVMLGDNGIVSGSGATAKWTFYDLDPAGAGPHPAADLSGPDTMSGNDGTDWMFGQGNADVMSGGAADDRMQGNAGADTIEGDEGADDIVGGSAYHYVGMALTALPAQVDGADTISGDDPTGTHGAADRSDAIVGDNGRVDRTGSTDPNTLDAERTIRLFDVQVAGATALPANGYGNDVLSGNDATDYVFGGGGDDTIHGHAGDDRVEGNAGADTIYGDSGDDDVVGGSSSLTDGIVRFTAPAVTAAATVTNLADAGDTIDGGSGEDAVLADNGVVARTLNSGLWTYHAAPYAEIPRRVVQAPISHEVAGAFGNDTVDGGTGHDELYGELGNDTVSGNDGDDAVLGDLGRVTPSVNGLAAGQNGKAQTVLTDVSGFVNETVYATGSLQRDTTLYDIAVGGNDVVDGGRGNDWLRGGAGNDTLSGNGGATDADADLANVCRTAIALTCDRDVIFGDDGDDSMWGGPDKDHMYGGYGTDHIDVVRPGTVNPQAKFKGPDVMYGGWQQDAMQSDVSAPNPNGDDKLIDTTGVYNIYYVCEGAYGGNSVVRTLSPSMISTLQSLATSDGGFDTTASGSSGFDELSMVFTGDVKKNTSPAYVDTPGNFTCA